MTPYTWRDANKRRDCRHERGDAGQRARLPRAAVPGSRRRALGRRHHQRHLRLYALLDGRFGNKLFNSTEQFRCRSAAEHVPRTERSDGSARAAGGGRRESQGTQAGYIEDGAFTKLREVSITYFAPAHGRKRSRQRPQLFRGGPQPGDLDQVQRRRSRGSTKPARTISPPPTS